MTKILAIDTSTSACSAALLMDGRIYEQYELQPQQHTQLILPMLDKLLAEAGISLQQLDAVAFACGPGSFTGLRIAAGVVQGIAFAVDLPVVPISTLLALAQTGYRIKGWNRILTAIDARMTEVYWAGFQLAEHKVMAGVYPEQLINPGHISLTLDELWYGVGDGWRAYADNLKKALGDQIAAVEPDLYPAAQDIAVLAELNFRQGKTVSAEHAVPTYLRDNMYKKN